MLSRGLTLMLCSEKGEGKVNFDESNGAYYSKDLTEELMKLFVDEGATTFFVDNEGRAQILNVPDPDDPTKQELDIAQVITWNGRQVTINREGGHHHHFHVDFPTLNPQSNDVTLSLANGVDPVAIPKGTEVTITSNELRDLKNWVLLEGVPFFVEITDGIEDKSFSQSNGAFCEIRKVDYTSESIYKKVCKVNSLGKFEITFKSNFAKTYYVRVYRTYPLGAPVALLDLNYVEP